MGGYKLRLPAPTKFSNEDLQIFDMPILALMAGRSTMHNSEKAVENGQRYVKNIEIEN